ncbi:MAG: 16S rRNA (guanine(966)-N(2))-methyltransferase RsmD, partial [Lysobacter sp.]|nr:16S rRNA (guanine(966)-N(2))-methyltransferase RsmD [Lysobacter sp.]
ALAAALRATVARLPGGEATQVVQADALAWLSGQADGGYDLAFVDPPFAAGLWDAVWPALLPKLAAGAWLYVEAPRGTVPALPPDWLRHREGGTREVDYALYRQRPAVP